LTPGYLEARIVLRERVVELCKPAVHKRIKVSKIARLDTLFEFPDSLAVLPFPLSLPHSIKVASSQVNIQIGRLLLGFVTKNTKREEHLLFLPRTVLGALQMLDNNDLFKTDQFLRTFQNQLSLF